MNKNQPNRWHALSPEAQAALAERDYGVVFHSSNLEIDEEATQQIRSERRKEKQK